MRNFTSNHYKMSTYKAKIDGQIKFVMAFDLLDAYKRVELYHKGAKIEITHARKRSSKSNKLTWA